MHKLFLCPHQQSLHQSFIPLLSQYFNTHLRVGLDYIMSSITLLPSYRGLGTSKLTIFTLVYDTRFVCFIHLIFKRPSSTKLFLYFYKCLFLAFSSRFTSFKHFGLKIAQRFDNSFLEKHPLLA